MFDIGFYMRVSELKKQLMDQKLKGMDKLDLFNKIEELRSPNPVIYNIETTNACNMQCQMCPRTTMMTRKVETMDMAVFEKIIDQIKPFTRAEISEWERFAEENYGIKKEEMSENHFFLYVIPLVLVLHGYGDPLLDKHMPDRVKLLTERNIPSYFSCNPANINIDKTLAIFESGLGYIKYSIESVDDMRHKQIRGKASNFSESYKKIIHLLEMKKKHGYKTTFVITMLDLVNEYQEEEFEKLKKAFAGRDVYIYLKSQDQKWYQDKNQPTKSIHWTEFCQFPWSSMTIKSNAEAVECVEDFNNEIILGDASKERLSDIWNGNKYRKFRQDHFDLTKGIKCTEQCDMRLIGSLVEGIKSKRKG
ncbi:MAG: radical SAM protein [Sedimentisphaerales bacterium]|jgi:MoaA/NifB/PqqE/SkfB family radical SAM enzyme